MNRVWKWKSQTICFLKINFSYPLHLSKKLLKRGEDFSTREKGTNALRTFGKRKKKEKEKEKKRKKKSTRVLTKGRCSFCGDPRGGACIHANAGAFIPFAGRGS